MKKKDLRSRIPGTITQKLCISLGTVVCLTVTGIMWAYYNTSRTALEQEVNARSLDRLDMAARQLDDYVSQVAVLPRAMASRQTLKGRTPDADLRPYLKQLLHDTPEELAWDVYVAFDDYHKGDPRMMPWYDRVHWPKETVCTYDIHDDIQEWYNGPKRTGTLYFTEPFFDDGGANLPLVSVTLPIKDKEDKFLGVTGVDLVLGHMQQMVAATRLGDGKFKEAEDHKQFAFLASPKGLLIAHPDSKLLPARKFEGTKLDSLPDGKLTTAEKRGFATLTQNGVSRRVYWTTSALTNWKIVVNVPEETLFYTMGELRTRALIAGLVILGALLIPVMLISRAIARPLSQLAQVAKALANGDTSQTITLESRDEVGAVASAFRAVIGYQQQMAEAAQTIASGDLSQEITPKSPKDTLGHAFQAMSENLRSLIGRITENAEAVAATSVQLAGAAARAGQATAEIEQSVQEVSGAVEQSARSSEEMARGSEQQARNATSAAGAMSELQAAIARVHTDSDRQQQATQEACDKVQHTALSVNEVTESAEKMALSVQKAARDAEAGGTAVEQTIASMSRIREQVAASAEKVEELGQKGQAIGAIVETIEQIAEQTNLLALNAAIEAARAGEHGRGFAVVADEVRKLAERAALATREIGTLIADVRAGVSEAVSAMESSTYEVAEGARKSEEAGSTLMLILQGVQSVAGEVEEVNTIAASMNASMRLAQQEMEQVRAIALQGIQTVNTMATGADQVAGAFTAVAAISQETAAGAEEMSAAAQEISASVQHVSQSMEEQSNGIAQVSESARALSEMAAQLQEMAQQFVLETESRDEPRLRLAA